MAAGTGFWDEDDSAVGFEAWDESAAERTEGCAPERRVRRVCPCAKGGG